MVENISPEIQQKLVEFQEAQQQGKMLMSQKYQLEMQLNESKAAISELEKSENAEVHKAVGQILIKSDKDTIVKELKEKMDTLEVRLKSIGTQEKKITDNLKSIQDRLQSVLPEAPSEKKE